MAGQHAARTEQSTTDGVETTTAAEESVVSAPDEGDGAIPCGTSPVKLAILAGVALVVALGGLTGWLGWRAHDSTARADQGEEFLQVGRQGALNLTDYDYDDVDAQVRRTLDLATGKFYADFQRRAPSFANVVKQVKSKSSGTVTDAGLESQTPTSAKVLVAVTVTSEIAGQPAQQPRLWRMRLSVDQTVDGAKVSDVEFGVVTATRDDGIDGGLDGAVSSEEAARIEQDAPGDVPDDVETPAARTRGRILAYGVLPALMLVLAIGAGAFKYVDATQRGDERSGTEAVDAAKSAAAQMLSYTPENVRRQLSDARRLLTGEFRSRYAVMADNVVIPGAQTQHITAVATVPAAAVVSADERQVVVLLFVDQTVTVGAQAPAVTASTVRATLTRVDGNWLVSAFTPA